MSIKVVDRDTLQVLSKEAAVSPRLRCNHNLHPELDDPVQRFCNAMEPGTYVRPHRHQGTDRWELFIALRGRAALLSFDERGKVSSRIELAAESQVVAAEIAGNTWHALAALVPETVVFEVKRGPYHPLADKDFAPWAPAEGEGDVGAFVAWYETALVGSRPPGRSVS